MPLPSLDLYVIKRAVINASSNGDNTIVSAVTNKQIFVLNYFLVAGGTVNVTWQSGASGTALSGAIPLIANTGVACASDSMGWIETVAGSLLNLSLSSAIQVSGTLTYIER